jgi:tetratricopeptide (TPR) repeat protein
VIFSGNVCWGIGDSDKAVFFYNQARLICDMSHSVNHYNSTVFIKLGDAASQLCMHEAAVKLYKRGLQYAWYHNVKEDELKAYDKLGVAYYY